MCSQLREAQRDADASAPGVEDAGMLYELRCIGVVRQDSCPDCGRSVNTSAVTLADPTVRRAVLPVASVGFVDGMPLLASDTRFVLKEMHALDIDVDRHRLQVSGVLATSVTTEVVDAHALRDGADPELVGKTMRGVAVAGVVGFDAMPSVTEGVLVAEPGPAGVGPATSIDLAPEALLGSRWLPIRVATPPPTLPMETAQAACEDWFITRKDGTHVYSPTIVSLIISYDWPCDEALGVVYGNARCPYGESTGDPNAYSGGNYGLYQINAIHAARVGYDLGRLFDPATNIGVAYGLWLERGWQPWACRP